MLIHIGSDEASDAWGFVGVVKVGEVEAYRTLAAFASPLLATEAAQKLVGDVLGELLAGREWRGVREETRHAPTRKDFELSAFNRQRRRAPEGTEE